MLNSSLCDYNDAYVLVKGTVSIAPAPQLINTIINI